MSRFGDYGDNDGSTITWEMWEHNVNAALNGKRGQKALRELLLALDAIPGHRLIRDSFASSTPTTDAPDGQACAIGAWVAYKRIATGKATGWRECIEQLETQYGYPEGYETSEIGKRELGITRVLAEHLAWRNDEMYHSAPTPEALWEATRAYVLSKIRE